MQPRSRSVLRRPGLSECPNDVAVEGSGDELVDGEVILSFHEWSGVEIGTQAFSRKRRRFDASVQRHLRRAP